MNVSRDNRSISHFVIKRLPRYYRYLGNLLDKEQRRVSSQELSELMNVTASQIRQDFNQFGSFGQQGYGYNIPFLYNEIKNLLGLSQSYHMILIGGGNLGQALAKHEHFVKRGFVVDAVFDSDESKTGMFTGNAPILHSLSLPEYLSGNKTDIAVLTLPESEAQAVTDVLCANGINAIWNFTNCEITVPPGVYVENVHLMDSLMTLAFNLAEINKNVCKK